MTKTDWTAKTTDRLRTIVEFVNGKCTNEEAGRKCLGFIMQYGESWLERIAADESAVPVGWTHELMWKNHESERVCKITRHAQDVHGFSTPLFTHPPAQPVQESPCSLNEALNVIEHWGRRGNTLNGDDVDRFRALADKIAPAQEQPGWKVPDGDFPERKWFVVTGNNEAETPILVFTSRGIADEYCARNPSKRGYRVYEAASPTPPKEK